MDKREISVIYMFLKELQAFKKKKGAEISRLSIFDKILTAQ